jgi:beta-mannosidase
VSNRNATMDAGSRAEPAQRESLGNAPSDEETVSHQDEVTRREFLHLAGATAFSLSAAGRADAAVADTAAGEERAVSPRAKNIYDLSSLKWQLCGITPYLWGFDKLTDIHAAPDAEIAPIDAPVPGSVQTALLRAGVIPDWNVALNSRQAEWVENRDWIYQTRLPDEWLREGQELRLKCAGLDYCGKILLNGKIILSFEGSFTPYEVDLKPHLAPGANLLQIWFQPPPRWLGQFGYTSEMTEWKPRFNYTWDWIIRVVQIGIWDAITLEAVQDAEIGAVQCLCDANPDLQRGSMRLRAEARGGTTLRVALKDQDRLVREQSIPAGGTVAFAWDGLPIELWWPNGMGRQKLYKIELQLLDARDRLIDQKTLRVGFRNIGWKRTAGASADAPPYLCVVNGKELFLFGVNWTPIRPNFADLSEADYRKRIGVYRDIGVNALRVWGGGFPERQCLFDLCDENGLLIWQEFPLSSSGLDNYPPDDPASIRDLSAIAASYIARRQHHASLLLWCGGNELEDNYVGRVSPQPTLTIDKHPLLVRFAAMVKQSDPGRAFLPTSPFGPQGSFSRESCGTGTHWDVHGPWNLDGPVDGSWRDLWEHDDAMFHSEMGAPSTSSAALIRRYKGDLPEIPGTHSNPLWNRQPWWIDWPKFAQEKGRAPASLDEFVAWSQKRQTDALVLAVSAAKSRFPACGGVILWMGHDCFPCTNNASIVDFDGEPKPAALALKELFA